MPKKGKKYRVDVCQRCKRIRNMEARGLCKSCYSSRDRESYSTTMDSTTILNERSLEDDLEAQERIEFYSQCVDELKGLRWWRAGRPKPEIKHPIDEME